MFTFRATIRMVTDFIVNGLGLHPQETTKVVVSQPGDRANNPLVPSNVERSDFDAQSIWSITPPPTPPPSPVLTPANDDDLSIPTLTVPLIHSSALPPSPLTPTLLAGPSLAQMQPVTACLHWASFALQSCPEPRQYWGTPAARHKSDMRFARRYMAFTDNCRECARNLPSILPSPDTNADAPVASDAIRCRCPADHYIVDAQTNSAAAQNNLTSIGPKIIGLKLAISNAIAVSPYVNWRADSLHTLTIAGTSSASTVADYYTSPPQFILAPLFQGHIPVLRNLFLVGALIPVLNNLTSSTSTVPPSAGALLAGLSHLVLKFNCGAPERMIYDMISSARAIVSLWLICSLPDAEPGVGDREFILHLPALRYLHIADSCDVRIMRLLARLEAPSDMSLTILWSGDGDTVAESRARMNSCFIAWQTAMRKREGHVSTVPPKAIVWYEV